MNFTIEMIINGLYNYEDIMCAYFVGSYTHNSDPHDIDILLIVKNTNKERFRIFLETDFNATDCFSNDDSISCQINNMEFDFAFLTLEQLELRVQLILQNRLHADHRNWCVGYWMPEGFISDVKSAYIIFERNLRAKTNMEQLKNIKDDFTTNLMDEIQKEILLKSKLKLGMRYYNFIARSDVYAAFMRLINLQQGWNLTSFKHINRVICTTEYASILDRLMETSDEVFQKECIAVLGQLQ